MNKILKCSFITLGCKVNQYETDFMTQCLINEGYVVEPLSPESDYVIINTCTVTNEADRKSRQMIRRAKKVAPNARTIAMGCSIQAMQPEKRTIADYHFGNGEKKDIVEIVNKIQSEQTIPDSIQEIDKAYWLRHDELTCFLNNSGYKTRQNIMIQEGCNNTCSYCKIYHVRGTKSVSKDPGLIISEIKAIGEKTCQEFILTGINLGAYEWNGLNLSGLLKKINCEVDDSFRIRLSSLNPEDISDELCEQLKSKRYCHHLHLSIQSGSNNILKKMNRKYDNVKVIEAVEKLRKIDPLFSISCDIIVGFPGETRLDFEDSLVLIKRIKPLKTHIFRYSMKKGTPAASFKNQIDGTTKKNRASTMDSIAKRISVDVRNNHIGKIREIIVENTTNEALIGHDEYYLKHISPLNGKLYNEGERLKVKIVHISQNSEPDEVKSSIEGIH